MLLLPVMTSIKLMHTKFYSPNVMLRKIHATSKPTGLHKANLHMILHSVNGLVIAHILNSATSQGNASKVSSSFLSMFSLIPSTLHHSCAPTCLLIYPYHVQYQKSKDRHNCTMKNVPENIKIYLFHLRTVLFRP